MGGSFSTASLFHPARPSVLSRGWVIRSSIITSLALIHLGQGVNGHVCRACAGSAVWKRSCREGRSKFSIRTRAVFAQAGMFVLEGRGLRSLFLLPWSQLPLLTVTASFPEAGAAGKIGIPE